MKDTSENYTKILSETYNGTQIKEMYYLIFLIIN